MVWEHRSTRGSICRSPIAAFFSSLRGPAPDLLCVEGLTTAFQVDGRSVPAVRGISFQVRAGETLALVGESGSGKSVTALSLLRLLPTAVRITSGSVQWRARDLAGLENAALEQIRGGEIALVPQDPATALNPIFVVGDQIMETLLAHAVATPRDVHRRMLNLLDTVHIPHPAQRARDYPHQLSGGLRQQVMLALGLAVLIISHDLDVVASCADRVAVMYAGEIVKQGPTRRVLDTPAHPYTLGLLASVPNAEPGTALPTIDGVPPAPGFLGPSCAFAPRCPQRFDPCERLAPAVDVSTICHLYDPAPRAPAMDTPDAQGQ
jgi:peptide/nickel transport system ATP-binding protein